MTARILFYIQHLMGVGHQKRAAAITRAMMSLGLNVTYVSGGYPVPGLEIGGAAFEQLPPCRAADSTFSVLLDGYGNAIDEVWKTKRRDLLTGIFKKTEPQVLLVEMYPFGRRLMRFELDPLMETAAATAPRPKIACSVRDIIERKSKPDRYDEIKEKITRWFDAVFVHSDPDLIPLEATVPVAVQFSDRLHYTGYVGEREARTASGAGRGEVIVSAGSGRVGEDLLEAAIAARPLSKFSNATWRLLVGDGVPDSRFNGIRAAAPKGMVVERPRDDYQSLLANCAVSVSRGGYNTTMDVLAEGTSAVFVPYSTDTEQEQVIRARILADRGLVQLVEERDLTPAGLARAVDTADNRGALQGTHFKMDGAETTARMVAELAESTG